MRRPWLPVALAIALVASSAYALAGLARLERQGDGGVAPGPRLATPALSLRRAPLLLHTTVARARLTTDLDAVLDDRAMGAARDATCLTVEEGNGTIYARHADRKLIPASTLKVLTGMAALRRLGSDFSFVTQVRAQGVVGGVVQGPLWLVGSGDPLLATAAYAASFRNQPQVFTSLDTLADAIVASGLREIAGGVMGDESRFDAQRYLPSWKPVYITNAEIGPVSALTVNDNFEQYRPKKAIATAAPARHAAAVLTELLRGRGVLVGPPAEGVAPADAAVVVASVTSPLLPEIVGELLRESDNMTAEMLAKELGRRFGAAGSWAEGVRVIRETIGEAGLGVEGYEAVDGSGLDVTDRVSCSVLMDALDLAGPNSPVADGFAVAGRTGTLAQRFKGNPAEGRLRAKTGSLNFVAGLAGFVSSEGATTLEFALLANDLPDRTASGRLLQERVGAILSQYPRAPSVEALSPVRPQ